MIGLSWNCREISKKRDGLFLKESMRDNQVDFVGLQKTIKKSYSGKFFRKVDPNKTFAWNWIPAKGRSGGILCGINLDRFDVTSVELGNFSIMALVVDRKLKKNLRLATVYGPAQDDRKEPFLTELSHICTINSSPMLVGGNFNIMRFSSEKKNKTFKGNKFTDMFNLIINSHDLREISMMGGKYTWRNNQKNPMLEKLDRFLMNESWEQEFPLTNVRKIPKELLSDHNL